MMSLESLKIDLTKQLFNIDKVAVLNKIKSILDEEEIVAYTVDGTPLTRKSYLAAVKKSEEEMNQGDFITHEQLRQNSKKW